MKSQAKGKLGECIARIYLRLHLYKILEKNFRTNTGEIDIIAKKGETIVFVEVKFRTNTEKGLPGEAVNYRKQKHIQNTALCYLKYKNCMESDIRFDVIEILNFKITHIKNAF